MARGERALTQRPSFGNLPILARALMIAGTVSGLSSPLRMVNAPTGGRSCRSRYRILCPDLGDPRRPGPGAALDPGGGNDGHAVLL